LEAIIGLFPVVSTNDRVLIPAVGRCPFVGVLKELVLVGDSDRIVEKARDGRGRRLSGESRVEFVQLQIVDDDARKHVRRGRE
jgi:hypothetical protein